jgi:large subunit ribosomal protein L29
MTKASEYREMSGEQLTHELRQLIEELFRLTVQAATERLDAPSNLRKLRRDIARIKTIQREQELAAVVLESEAADVAADVAVGATESVAEES